MARALLLLLVGFFVIGAIGALVERVQRYGVCRRSGATSLYCTFVD
jgi:hypothetical protein